MLAAIEAGGTKFVCAIGDIDYNVIDIIEIPTTTPTETMGEVKAFFNQYEIKSMAIGTFGPADINRNSSKYGCITTTPKQYWRNFNMLGYLQEFLSIPIVFNTDVNIAAVGEAKFGASQNVKNSIYVTIGTGIGVGAIVDGQMLQGLSHSEMGHVIVRRHPQDSYAGCCPFHKDCLEGMASGPAIEKRWNQKAVLLEENDDVWEIEGYYIAQALMTYILTLSPEKIILGGGVMKQRQLLPVILKYVQQFNNHYLSFSQLEDNIDEYIVTPGIEGYSAIKGAFYLAKRKLIEK
ncbi:ROK family protein [Bacillus sp. SD088]|uniref:ROK family protein n=1 Tax=Bacillus sp. SD088 TaxID=2782012 RepID=UPI001A95917D|nr:ROK family protein [Bacillus sp. SD088]MBO0994914.1 ROK family protein [Bacillus sp. SD088]